MDNTTTMGLETKLPVTELEIASPVAIATHAATELAVPADRATALFAPFAKPFAVAAALIAEEPSATDAASARVLRLKLVKARTEIGRTKDIAKADVKIVGNLIDWYHNKGRNDCQAVEARLEEIEKAEERAEAERKAKIKAERLAELATVCVDGQYYPLGEMPAEAYNQLLSSSRLAHAAKIAAEEKAKEDARIAAEKAEADHIAREKAEAEERERIRIENERLRKEAAEKEAALKAEREAAAKQKAEDEARAKAERERLEAIAAEERRKAAEAAETARKEAARIEAENAKAREEAAEKARKDREAIEAKAKAERDAAEALAREWRKKADEAARIEASRKEAEERRQREEMESASRAAAAPDREKLQAFAAVIRTLELPEMSTKAGKQAAAAIAGLVEELAIYTERAAIDLQAKKGATS
jgi:hypothetical protein